MKIGRYLQGYKEGQEVLINKIKNFIDKESEFIPNEGFNYLLDKLSQIIREEENLLKGEISNGKKKK